TRASRQSAPRFSVSGEIATRCLGRRRVRQANQHRKRVRARLLHDGRAMVLDGARLMNAGPAAREPRTRLSRMLSYHTPLNPTAKLCIATTGFFRRCSRPNQDGALLKWRVDDSLLAVVDPVESWTARQHLCACGGKSTRPHRTRC